MQERHLQQSTYLNALAVRSGCRDFNEMWDHLFESTFTSRSTESFMREITTYCYFARHESIELLLTADGTNARKKKMPPWFVANFNPEKLEMGRALSLHGAF